MPRACPPSSRIPVAEMTMTMAMAALTTSCAALLLPPLGRPVASPDRPASVSAFPVRMGLFDWLPGNQKEPVPPGYVQARHILFLAEPSAEKKADQLQSRILAGEISFSEAARAFSCCPSRDLNGDLGTPRLLEEPWRCHSSRRWPAPRSSLPQGPRCPKVASLSCV